MRSINNVAGSLNADDLEAASILLELSSISEVEPVRRFAFFWATRKKRSVRKRTEESPAAVCRSDFDACEIAEACASPESPDTTLLFPSIESDENLNFPKTKDSRKRKREGFLESINQLTRNKELLTTELENVRQYYLKQETLNLQLKFLRQQFLIAGGMQMQTPPGNGRIFGGVDQHQPRLNHDHRQPLMYHQMAPGEEIRPSLSSLSCGIQNGVVESHGALVQIRAAAIARQRRKEICRSKNSNTVSHKLFACTR